MQRLLLSIAVVFTLFSCSLDDRDFPQIDNPIDNDDYELVHYWNFNDKNTLTIPTQTTRKSFFGIFRKLLR